MFGSSRRFVTGLDVGTESVKAVRLLHSGANVRLVGIALADIAQSKGNGGVADYGRKARVEAISRALEASGTDTSGSCRVVTAVEGPSISVKHVTFPKMPSPSLAESIGWEAKKHVPFGASEFVLDFQLLARQTAEEANDMHVVLAAVEQRHVDDHVQMLIEGGVEPDIVDIVPLALMNELSEEGLIDDGAIAAVEMGAGTLSVSVYRVGGLLLVRSVRIPSSHGGDGATSGSDAGRAELLDEWRTFVLKEVQRSLAFYNSETGRHGIDRIYLSGGRALDSGVVDAFRDLLKVPTEVLNPLEGIADADIDIESLREQGPRFALAMGLARRR